MTNPLKTRHTRLLATASGLLIVLAAATAQALVVPPVAVELLGPPRAATAGQPFSGELRLTVGEAGDLQDFYLAGAGWNGHLNTSAFHRLDKDTELIVPFTATPIDPGQTLYLEFSWNDVPVRVPLDLSLDHLTEATVPGRLNTERTPTYDPGPADDLIEEDAVAGGTRSSLRVSGRFTYRHDDGSHRGVDTARILVRDNDPIDDDTLGSGYTDTDGYFDFTVTYDQGEDPDVYLRFRATNDQLDVEDAVWHQTYEFDTPCHSNYTDPHLEFGIVFPSTELGMKTLNIFTSTTRAWRWFDELGYDPSFVDIVWPHGDDDTHYNPASGNIHISRDREWDDGAYAHELGHHIQHDFGDLVTTYYCNEMCDSNYPFSCGHCLWCAENASIAWQEGFADWAGHMIPSTMVDRYGVPSVIFDSIESVEDCSEDSEWHNPNQTEGFMAAAMIDLCDSANDNDPHYPDVRDQLTLGADEVMQIMSDDQPDNPSQFFADFLDLMPDYYRTLIWETVANCGFDLDEEQATGVIININCETHEIGVPSSAHDVRITWSDAPDDMSGIAAYCYEWSLFVPVVPGETDDLDAGFPLETHLAIDGTHYVTVRARDKAGNWSPDYATIGPIIVAPPTPSDLAYWLETGWQYVLVPDAEGDATFEEATVSPILFGDTAATSYSMSFWNNGEQATNIGGYAHFYLDNQFQDDGFYGTLGPFQHQRFLNAGALWAPGGRHVFHTMLDAMQTTAETNENNNRYGHQFIWQPETLTVDEDVVRAGPANAFAGWQYVTDGSDVYENCLGTRIQTSGWWNAVVMWTDEATHDYDLTLHSPSTGSEHGFWGGLAHSYRPAGCIDAVLVNRNITGFVTRDAGVFNFGGSTDAPDVNLLHIVSDDHFFPITTDVMLFAHDFLRLDEFQIEAEDTGPISLFISTYPPLEGLHLHWLDRTFEDGSLVDGDPVVTTDANGEAYLAMDIADAGYYCLVIYRDPGDPDNLVTITIDAKTTPPDLTTQTRPGWHSPVVPRPADDGSSTEVALPDTLHGNIASTYYNMQFYNDSPTDAYSSRFSLFFDGANYLTQSWFLLAGGSYGTDNHSTPLTVSGGRHSLALVLDPYEETAEIDETNNIYGEQYVWSPLITTVDDLNSRPMPPGRTDGWDLINSGEPAWFNCDGLRLDRDSGWWMGVAVMPGDESDVDVRLHEMLVGVKDGFADNLVYSGWPLGLSDYVLVNFNQENSRDFDAGVLGISGVEDYAAHTVESLYIDPPEGTHGDYCLDNGQILHLREFLLSEGDWTIELEHLSGEIDWGITLHPSTASFVSKSDVVENGSAWYEGPEGNESITVTIEEGGYYCLGVWKVDQIDLSDSGWYQLHVTQEIVGVDGTEIPKVTRLNGAWPNPANPRAIISFDLAAPGPVELALYDVTGARVRRLVNDMQPAGRHQIRWDGKDDSGRPVASGIYLARMVAADTRQLCKVTLIR